MEKVIKKKEKRLVIQQLTKVKKLYNIRNIFKIFMTSFSAYSGHFLLHSARICQDQ